MLLLLFMCTGRL